MPRKGDLKPMDEFEESVRANVVKYNIVLFTPGSSSRVYQTVTELDEAKRCSLTFFEEMPRVRTAMIYAVNKDDRFALVGTMDRAGNWKPVVASRYQMKLRITGGERQKQNLCRDFAKHTLQSVCGSRLCNVLDVTIALSNTIQDQGWIGSCIHLDDSQRPRDFLIELDAYLSNRYLLLTLAHEIVHVKQYARGELKQRSSNVYKWDKKTYHVNETWNPKYNRLPWEIEARGMEEILLVEWAEHKNLVEPWIYPDMYDNGG